MKTYLRFGELPEVEKSLNYFTNKSEVGISVFEIDNGLPVLSNMNLISSLAARVEMNAYEVTGEVVGVGNDGEPLLNNVKIIQQINIPVQKLSDLILDTLMDKFQLEYGEDNQNYSSGIYTFTAYRKQNKLTGEIINYFDWLKSDEKKYIDLGATKIICYRGYSFENAIEGFDIHMGYVSK